LKQWKYFIWLIFFFHSYRNVCPSLLLEGPQTLPLCSSVNSSREYVEHKECLERYWREKPEVLAETLFPFLCVHHKSNKHWPGLGERPVNYRLRLKYYNSVLHIKILFVPHREKSVAFIRGSRLMYRETVFIVGIVWNFNTECEEECTVLLLQQVVHTITTGS
jgi:hypothetical protein